MELVVLTDVLSRAGIEVVRASATLEPVRLQHGTRVSPDARLCDVRDEYFDLIAIPGGWSGASLLDADPDLSHLLARSHAECRLIAAVCSAPNVLRRHGAIAGETPFTAHPDSLGFATGGRPLLDHAIVITPGVITGRSAGHTVDWALSLVERLLGKPKRDAVLSSLALLPSTAP